MLRLMREYSDTCNESYTHSLVENRRTLPDVNKQSPSTMSSLLPVMSPIKLWSEEIRKFGNRHTFTDKLLCFKRFAVMDSCEGLMRYHILRNGSHINFHLIDRQYNELCRCYDICRSTRYMEAETRCDN